MWAIYIRVAGLRISIPNIARAGGGRGLGPDNV